MMTFSRTIKMKYSAHITFMIQYYYLECQGSMTRANIQHSNTEINVEGVTLVLPSCLSCLTNIRENISYKLEYRLCETRSIRMSTSITLKKKGQAFFPPSLSIKVTWCTPAIQTLCLKAQAFCEHSILTLATFTGARETSLALKVPKSFGFEGTRGHNPKKP
jgi:hypothetical protein